MNVTIDTDDILHHTRDRAQIVRHHHNGNTFVELFQQLIQLTLETVIDKVGGLVQDQQTRLSNQCAAQQRTLHLSARNLANRSTRNRLQTCLFE